MVFFFDRNTNCFSSYPSETKQAENSAVSSQLYSTMAPDIAAYNWANNATTNHHCDQDLQQHSRIKDEVGDQYYRRYSEMLSSSPQSNTDDLSLRTDLQTNDDVATKFLLKSFSYGNLMNKIQLSPTPDHLYSNINTTTANARGFAQIFPSVNVSTLNQTPDMNLEALDLLASSRFSGNQIGILRDGFSNYGFDHMQQSHQIPFYHESNKVRIYVWITTSFFFFFFFFALGFCFLASVPSYELIIFIFNLMRDEIVMWLDFSLLHVFYNLFLKA